jgi:hypothetical protein
MPMETFWVLELVVVLALLEGSKVLDPRNFQQQQQQQNSPTRTVLSITLGIRAIVTGRKHNYRHCYRLTTLQYAIVMSPDGNNSCNGANAVAIAQIEKVMESAA